MASADVLEGFRGLGLLRAANGIDVVNGRRMGWKQKHLLKRRGLDHVARNVGRRKRIGPNGCKRCDMGIWYSLQDRSQREGHTSVEAVWYGMQQVRCALACGIVEEGTGISGGNNIETRSGYTA